MINEKNDKAMLKFQKIKDITSKNSMEHLIKVFSFPISGYSGISKISEVSNLSSANISHR